MRTPFTKKTFKAFQQLEYSDCGITCIRMICHYYGKDITLRTLRKMCDVSRLGISLGDIVKCLKDLDFEVAPVKITEEELLRMPLPAILFWNQSHFVVLYNINSRKEKFYVADPSTGKIAFNKADFMVLWKNASSTGLAIVMDPNENFSKSKKNDSPYYWRLLRFVKQTIRLHRKKFCYIILLTTISIAADTYTPLLFQQTIDTGINKKDISLVWMLIGSQFMISVGQYIANCISSILNTKIGLRMHMDMIVLYLQRLINKPLSFFDKKVNADLLQKLNDLNRIKSFLVSLPNTLFLTLTNLIVFTCLLVYYNIGVFFFFLITTLISFLWTRLFMQRRREIDYSYNSQYADNRNQIYELIYGMNDIRTNNAQIHKVTKWNNSQSKLNTMSIKSAFTDIYISSGNTFVGRMRDIFITGICATLVIKGHMTMGAMMTISYICGRLSSPFQDLVNMISTIQDASMSYERLDEVLNDEFTSTTLTHSNKELLSPIVDIVLDNVSFKYPGSQSPYVLKNISLHIQSGETIALVGESGCGKTTLLKLLLGFYPSTKGCIYINGKDLTKIEVDKWLKRCGVVMQNGYIFSGSILENIAISDEKPNIKQVKQAAQIACIDQFFESLPMGYHTKIGSNGMELSGGQKQRLLIARAIYKQPMVLVLDEATSSLDAKNERQIVENLSAYNQGRTVIIAAHRLSTIMNANKIAFFDKGELKEFGTHDELIAHKGLYYQLICAQMENNSRKQSI